MNLILLFILITHLSASATGQGQFKFDCGDGNYTTNSTYESNLRSLLSSLSSDTAFYNASTGRGNDTVYAIAFCRSDVTLNQCRPCVRSAPDELLKQCPNHKQAILWYESCMLRYSNDPIYGFEATVPSENWRNTEDVPNLAEFQAARTRLYDVVRPEAANRSEPKVAVGSTNVSANETMYMMLECTPDLSGEECDNCLLKAAGDFRGCCDTVKGVRILLPSCNLRYELLPFYNQTRLQELQVTPSLVPLPPSPPPPSATGQGQFKFDCGDGNYTTNSTYESNLRSLLSSLSSDTAFYNASTGRGNDTVYAVAFCRADVTLNQCRPCVRSAPDELLKQCPNHKQAILWYESCMLRYSNDPIYGLEATVPSENWRNTEDVPNLAEFQAARTRLYDVVRPEAANRSEPKVAVGSTNVSVNETMYMMVECTPDLSGEECDNCLLKAAGDFGSCCDTVKGVRILLPSCNLRYELLPFYNQNRLLELQVTPSLVPSPPLPSGRSGNNNSKEIIIIVVIVGVTLLLIACAVFFMRKRMKRRKDYIPQATEDISTVESLQYGFDTVKDATDGFADLNKLGEGGFGAVYHGNLPNGEEIAVKRLSRNSGQGIAEFKNEVLLMARLQHRNLVRLLGFSTEVTERVLVYEYVENLSLDKFIFDPIKRSLLDWGKRYKIIGGIAKGLVYLHEDSRLKIIHRDLKASNILLDRDMNPKIADFGMARLCGQDETQGNTSKIVGTYGYMSPEYAMHGQFSTKSDVFSFGVLTLEIITGRRNTYIQSEENSQDLLTIAWKNWREGTPEKVIDPMLMNECIREIVRCLHIGLLCVQEHASNRPTMASIVLMLSSSTITLPLPSEPAFYMASHFGPVVSEFSSKEYSSSNPNTGISQDSSRNDMSVTELYPR